MRSSRTTTRLRVVAFVLTVGAVFISTQAEPAQAEPICASTLWGTSCADATGTCLIANYPNHGPATCFWNPVGPLIGR